jgi:type VI secretion system protein ImpK
MNIEHNNESFLLSQFREFYTEVIRLKRLVKDEGWVCSPEAASTGKGKRSPLEAGTWVYFPEFDGQAATGSPGPAGHALVVRETSPSRSLPDYAYQPPSSDEIKLTLMVWQSLRALFERNLSQVMRLNGVATETYREAQYLMAAFADEVFIHLEWAGSRMWTSHLLETALFHSHVAGELVFEKLDRLLADRDPGKRGLAALYLNVLSLGFRGKYYGSADVSALNDYRRQLFAFVFQHPSDLKLDSKVAFPDAYGQKLAREPKRKLTNPRLWIAVLCVVIAGYLAISHLVWITLTDPLEKKVNQDIVPVEQRLERLSEKR